jgi:hypothetical protein
VRENFPGTDIIGFSGAQFEVALEFILTIFLIGSATEDAPAALASP